MNDKVTGINLKLPPASTANADALQLIATYDLAIDHGGPTLAVTVGNAQLIHLLPQLHVHVVEPTATASLDVEPIDATGRHVSGTVDGIQHLQRHALLAGRLGLALILLGDLLLLLGGDLLQLLPVCGVGVPSHFFPSTLVAPLLVVGLEHGLDARLALFGSFIGVTLGDAAKARGGNYHRLRVDRVAPVDVLEDAVAYSGSRVERSLFLSVAIGRTMPSFGLLHGQLEVGQTLLLFLFCHGQRSGDGILLRGFVVSVIVVIRIGISRHARHASICCRRGGGRRRRQ